MQLLGRTIGTGHPLFLIAGPCVIESEALCLEVAESLRALADRTGMLVVFKASFDKANRSAATSYRGCGLDEGLKVLAKVRAETGLPVITDKAGVVRYQDLIDGRTLTELVDDATGIAQRVVTENRAGGRAKETPIGWVPRYKDIDWTGLNFSEEKFEELQAFDRAAWRAEVLGHEELFLDLHSHLPKEMIYERELLICRM